MSEIKIEVMVPSDIFEGTVVKSRLNSLFSNSEKEIKERISKILDHIEVQPTKEFSYENILPRFKRQFCTEIANEAVKRAFLPNFEHDIYEGILTLLSQKRMEHAVRGNLLVDILQDILREQLPEAEKKEALRNSELCKNLKEISID